MAPKRTPSGTQRNCADAPSEGTLVWHKVKGFPMWPAKIVSATHPKRPHDAKHANQILLRYFGTRDFCWVSPSHFGDSVVLLEENWDKYANSTTSKTALAEAIKYAQLARTRRQNKQHFVHDDGLSDFDDETDSESEQLPQKPKKQTPTKIQVAQVPVKLEMPEKKEVKEKEPEETEDERIVTFSSRGRKRNQCDFLKVLGLKKRSKTDDEDDDALAQESDPVQTSSTPSDQAKSVPEIVPQKVSTPSKRGLNVSFAESELVQDSGATDHKTSMKKGNKSISSKQQPPSKNSAKVDDDSSKQQENAEVIKSSKAAEKSLADVESEKSSLVENPKSKSGASAKESKKYDLKVTLPQKEKTKSAQHRLQSASSLSDTQTSQENVTHSSAAASDIPTATTSTISTSIPKEKQPELKETTQTQQSEEQETEQQSPKLHDQIARVKDSEETNAKEDAPTSPKSRRKTNIAEVTALLEKVQDYRSKSTVRFH
eukprot:TRINITY_DN5139_c0_g1_i6.p1 TRINITY_DN5139_c0_g1~~TRINITY_DN5139_c0_g1_i6.p1  ORF type:complete len:486 (-),score=143.99 TRINITY_DN5139_c0_g1_i6:143-1600(-)